MSSSSAACLPGRREFYLGAMIRPVLAAVALLALSACSAFTPSSAVAKSYTSVEQLRDDVVKAGYACPNWRQTNQVKLAAASGSCDGSSVLMLFLSEADVSANVQALKATGAPVHALAGPNWIVNVPNPTSLQKSMGGIVVEHS